MTDSELRQFQKEFEDDTIDFKRYFSLFLYNWYWFAIALLIALILSYGINRYSEKIFSVSATLLINDNLNSGGLKGTEAIVPGGDFFANLQNLNNEIGILKSYTLNKRVIDSLRDFHIEYVGVGRRNIVERRLYKDSPFIVESESGIMQPHTQVFLRILSKDMYRIEIDGNNKLEKDLRFGDLFEGEGFSFKVKLRDAEHFTFDESQSNKFFFRFVSKQDIANYYRKKLEVNPIEKDATLLYLSLSGPVAEQESDYLNMLMKLYIIQGLEYKNQTADSTITFIDKQLDVVFKTLSGAENELEEFRRRERLIDLSSRGNILQNSIERYENEKTELELQKKYYKYLDEYLASRGKLSDIISPAIMGVTDQQLIRMVQELSQFQYQKKKLSINLRDESSPLNLIEEEIVIIKSSLKENIKEGTDYINLKMSDLNEKILLVEHEIEKLPKTEREMIKIQRKFDINNTIYTFLLEKRAEVGIAKASTVADNRIIDTSNIFNIGIVKPKRKQNNLLALLFGFIIPALGIYILDYLNNRIVDKKDVEKGTDAPVVGYISHNDHKSELPVNDKPKSTLAESFRLIRTNLKYFIKDNEHAVIAVSSTISAEGKTFISINLATILAMLGKKVLLIGLDLRKPRIHKVLDVDNSQGLSIYLSEGAEYKDVIKQTSVNNLYYTPAGPVPPNPAELIEKDRMKTFIDTAKKEFDYIIIDTPPIAIVTDALLVSPYVDMYLLVVRQRYSSRNTLNLIQDLYKNGTLKNLGIVINDISLSGYYGYGLRYGYSLGYGYSYGYNYYNKYTYEMYGDKYGGASYYTEDQ